MTKTLDVYLQDRYVGQYFQTESGLSEFVYADAYLSEQSAIPLSHSLPLRTECFTSSECRGFFAGILPEGEKRKIVAKNLGISANNDFSMLEQIGGECAGAITFLPFGKKPDGNQNTYRDLTEKQLQIILNELPKRPLLAGEKGIRLSLAGAQDKLAVRVVDVRISLPLGNAPSSHILKPPIERDENTVENEAFCMTLAREIGMHVAPVQCRTAGERKVLLIERYDRLRREDPSIPLQRLHQEDFCQALGIVPEKKYQDEGGVSLRQSFELLREVSTTPLIDLQRMLDAVIFNFLIGNHDAHGKNFSLLYETSKDGYKVRFAPLYDLICTTVYPDLSKKMAMSIGGKYKSESVMPEHFNLLAEETGLARILVRQRVKEMANLVIDLLHRHEVIAESVPGVREIVFENARRISNQF